MEERLEKIKDWFFWVDPKSQVVYLTEREIEDIHWLIQQVEELENKTNATNRH